VARADAARTREVQQLRYRSRTFTRTNKFIANLWLRGLREDLIEEGLGDKLLSRHAGVARNCSLDQLLEGVRGEQQHSGTGRYTIAFLASPSDSESLFVRRRVNRCERLATPSLRSIRRACSPVTTRSQLAFRRPGVVLCRGEQVRCGRARFRISCVCDFGRYQHGADHIDALHAARESIERAGFVGVVAAGIWTLRWQRRAHGAPRAERRARNGPSVGHGGRSISRRKQSV